MKTSCAVGLALVLTGAMLAEERPAVPAAPQPRVRLDPVTRTAIADPRPEQSKDPATSAVTMSPYIVRSTAIPSKDPQEVPQPTGPFSPLTGGWLARKDLGRLRFELGVWPYRNILWKSDRFKSDLNHVGTEFVRISW